MSEETRNIIQWVVGILFGAGGLSTLIVLARKRPQVVLHVKGHGGRSGLSGPLTCEVYFHCVLRNRSLERNSIDKLIFGIFNKRSTEIIWEASNAEVYEYDKKTAQRGDKIDLPIVLEGKAGKEVLVSQLMDENAYFNYLADRITPLIPNPNIEKPFGYKLIVRDSNSNHFTGGLNTDKPKLVNYKSLSYVSTKRVDLQNAFMLGRPKFRHLLLFYFGRILLWLRFRILYIFYRLGLVSST